MNETAHEQLSALMDGELARDEMRFLLRGLDRDADLMQRDLMQRWSRYQVARAVLQRQFIPGATGDDRFAATVMLRLDQERSAPPRAARLVRWAGGGAIAAAVAVVALMATRPAGENGSMREAAADAVAAAPSLPVPSLLIPQMPASPARQQQPIVAPLPAMPVSISDAQLASFESFVPRYAATPRNQGQSADVSPNGFVPYVLMVGARAKPDAQATAQPDAAKAQ